MDVREQIAKMHAEAKQNRTSEADLKAQAQQFWAEAQARHGEIIAAANVKREEAEFWERLAAEQEVKAGLTSLDVPATNGREQAS